jgi:two-component system, sensor histidine kinase and response regulator
VKNQSAGLRVQDAARVRRNSPKSSNASQSQQPSETESRHSEPIWSLAHQHENQRLAVRLLEKRGHHVTVSGNGGEVLEAFKSKTFDLLFMDLQMPEMNG